MARPHPLLVDVAAGRPIDPDAVTAQALADAAAHGMAGHLRDASVDAGAVAPPALERTHLAASAWSRRWWTKATETVDVQERAGFRSLVMKGGAEELVAGLRAGTRAPTDVDVLLHPDHGDDLAAAGRVLDAPHPAPDPIYHEMSTTVVRPGTVAIDLHVDPLKMATRSWNPERPWARLAAPEGHPRVRTFGPSAALVLRCVHHAHDGYRSLEHHATIRALAQAL